MSDSHENIDKFIHSLTRVLKEAENSGMSEEKMLEVVRMFYEGSVLLYSSHPLRQNLILSRRKPS